MRVRIVTKMDWPSFENTARTIQKALNNSCSITVHDWRNFEPGGRIIAIGTVDKPTLKSVGKLLPKTEVILYGTTEGLSELDAASLDVAKRVRVVAVSNFVKQMLEKAHVTVSGVLHHSIDMSDTKVDLEFYKKCRAKFAGRKIILTVSANHVRKGLESLLLACRIVEANLPNSFLILHSERTGYYDLEAGKAKLGLGNVWLTGRFGKMTQSRLNALYKLCTAYVQPSFSEGFGLPILEAYRFNKPVIAADTPPFDELIIPGKSGVLIPTEKVSWLESENSIKFRMNRYKADNLAYATIRILRDARLRAKMRSYIRREKWNWNARGSYPELLRYFS